MPSKNVGQVGNLPPIVNLPLRISNLAAARFAICRGVLTLPPNVSLLFLCVWVAWHFLVGKEDPVRKLADSVGFHYKYDPISKQFAHASGIMVLTPEGKLSRYFYGIEYKPRDFRLGLVEASQHKIGTPVDAIMLFCFHYDPMTGKYGFVIMNVIRTLGSATVSAWGTLLFVLIRRDRKHGFHSSAGSPV